MIQTITITIQKDVSTGSWLVFCGVQLIDVEPALVEVSLLDPPAVDIAIDCM